MTRSVLEFSGVHKSYPTSEGTVEVLQGVDFDLGTGEICALVGPSGSGKSTLLALGAGLEQVTRGEVILCGERLSRLEEESRARIRREKVGFIFQTFELLPSLTALENVMVPAELSNVSKPESLARELLSKVGLDHRTSHIPSKLSGGERQRVAIARAFVNSPEILFADEPTGNLDQSTSHQIVDLLFELNRERKTTLFIATHDLELAKRCPRRLTFTDQTVQEITADSRNRGTDVHP